MKTFCEIVISDFLPTIRALVTKELIRNYGFTQTEVAKKMSITQPAVSYYIRELRGTKVKLLEKSEAVMNFIKQFSVEIANGNAKPIEIQELCGKLQTENICTGKGLQKCSLCKC